MEKFPRNNPERKSGIIRIVGLEKGKEDEALEAAGELFAEKQEFLKKEREKTPEEKAVIAFLNDHLPKFLEHYGAQPLKISEDKIHIVSEKFFQSKKDVDARYSIDDQAVFMKDDPNRSPLWFANRLAHEIIHFHAFQSLVASPEGSALSLQGLRRFGFRVVKRGGEIVYFRHVDEALTEELAKRFGKKFFAKLPALREDLEQLKRLIAIKLKEDPIMAGQDFAYSELVEEKGYLQAALVPYAYPAEREELKELIADLYGENKNKFKSAEEVFELFARTAMTGRLLPAARLIEDTFGKGAFRDLGKSFEELR